jgi:prevent-host-death family protein
MDTVNIHEAKTHFSKLLEKLSSGEEREIIIAKAGQPVAKLTPIQHQPPKRVLGALADEIWEAPDCWEPDEELADSMTDSPLLPDQADPGDQTAKLPHVAESETNYET